MVKRSTKSKSKRVPLRKKYKILKKVKEHHKKKAKEAKKLGKTRRTKVEKDPGIPNDWPFKEQELHALEARRARALEEMERKKELKKERAQKRKLGLLEEDRDLKELANSVSDRQNEFAKKKLITRDSESGRIHDNSERTFYKELVKVIEASDVIVEVLDARDPLGSRCTDMEQMVLKAGAEKRLILLLNKIDLVPREIAEKWLKYFREELPTVAFKCNTQEQKSNLGWKSASKVLKHPPRLQTSDCLGADILIKLLKNYSRSYELKKSITVGVVGLPNVGKSSLINSIKRSHVVNVGATPGITRSMQEIQLDKHIKLLDCPGVVIAKSGDNNATIALRNCKRIEKLEDPITPVKEILRLCLAETLMSLYKLPSFSSVDEFLQKIASIRGKLKKGGVPDVTAAARIVLHDWNEGKIPYYTLPPTRNEGEHLDSAIVSSWGKEFDLDEFYKQESDMISNLHPMIDGGHVEIAHNSPLHMDVQLSQSEEDDMEEAESPHRETHDALGMETSEIVATKVKKTLNQSDKLYEAEGILNPHAARAAKKRRKKSGKVPVNVSTEVEDDDYNFAVDYNQQYAASGREAQLDEDDADENIDEGNDLEGAPMTGVELDAEE
ncbi:hypothetical protein SUGI_0403390 [Cryptomeria japonica]|uniref:guanine nucleotide-binding protein-like NSN1 n=1 Tax=Cryptomeria japonica TaxID=3369 RepID=UPI002408AB22|nr:guanine nucleotide-binding protein-like NSN1 [Cryptomeria japonica]XP_059075846.1 guanine nucleotide-binding protein-like NSN1 [Cryptomeria japonica]GLJ21658.1 hypothetical protein SUGI_0403390 [Cryptomeria japonica]